MSIRVGRRTGEGTWISGGPLEMVCVSFFEALFEGKPKTYSTAPKARKVPEKELTEAEARKARLAAHREAVKRGEKGPYFS